MVRMINEHQCDDPLLSGEIGSCPFGFAINDFVKSAFGSSKS